MRGVEIAQTVGEEGEQAPALLPGDAGERRIVRGLGQNPSVGKMGRTSTAPVPTGSRFAHARASSSVSTSTT
ncbi:hypothetical protein SAMN05421637_2398 [Demequina mangrovi]|uniref:Uncharacterized protein n=1 Tax=Demequina mangrovi TaxID=1043493 RepID=A0A1H7AGW6_9MICO|nr:hypothetical protein SAMN05421637_2398 [Demequina mangrovi]